MASVTQLTSGMDRPLARARRPRSRTIIAGAAVLGVAAAGWLWLMPTARSLRVKADEITVSTVTAAPFHDFIPLRGEVLPLESVVLDVAQGGRVDEVLAEAGQNVTAGQPLIRFSDPNLELEAIARETQVIEQINNQHALELSFETNRTNDAHSIAEAEYNIVRLGRQVERRTPLAGLGYASKESLDEAADELAYEKRLKTIAEDAQRRDEALIGKSVDLIHETAARLEENLAAAKRMLDTLVVRAPSDGVLTQLDAHVGEQKAKGARLGQIDRPGGGFKLTAQIGEYYLAHVRVGQHADITIDNTPAGLTVAKIYPRVTDGKFAIDLMWDGAAPAGLRRGEAVNGKLALGGDTDALTLPSGAFLEASGGTFAFVVDPAGHTATRRAVKLGRRTPDSVEIEDGLKVGDRVVTSDYSGYDRIEQLVIE